MFQAAFESMLVQSMNPMNQLTQQMGQQFVSSQQAALETTKFQTVQAIAKALKEEQAQSSPNAAVVEFYENQLSRLNSI